jgi:hypothetical protein
MHHPLAVVALTIASASGIEEENSGLAGGLINMTQHVGGIFGLAIIAAVAASYTHGTAPALTSVDSGFRGH